MDTQELLEQLHVAFPAECIDGNTAFAQWGRTYLDASEVARAIDGKTWQQVDHPFLVLRHDALGFLSTRELVQLLPVYLRSVVEEGLRSPALDSLLVELTRPKREPALGRFDALVATLTASQREVIAAVLEWISEMDPHGSPGNAARAALGATWKPRDVHA